MKLTIAHPEESAPVFTDYKAIKEIREAPYRPQGFEYVEIILEDVTGFAIDEGLLRIDFNNGDPPLRTDAEESWVVEAENG